jgi:hypothetical protein
MSTHGFPMLTARLRRLEAERAELIAAVVALLAACPDTNDTVVERHLAELALARAGKRQPDRHQLCPPSIDRRSVEDLFE